ncbi:MAG: diguanylate cyclase [Thermoleophilaceae bacterium]|nr:diguanylate cyclase [Thermoleophilaceae bacterium]
MAALQNRSFDVDEERMLAGKLAGVLFLSAGVSIVLLLFVPGVENRHWPWVLGLAAVCVAWAAFCLVLARPEEHGGWFWHVPAAASTGLIAGLMAATGGSASPARFYVFFLLFYACYFFPRLPARLYVAGCVGMALTPLAYDGAAVGEGYLGELIVLCTAYVTLGWLIIEGKANLVELRERARTLSLHDPLTGLPNRRALLDWLERQMDRKAKVGLILADLDGFKDVNTVHGYPAGDAVLCETARTLQSSVRSGDVVARLGGDEFAVLTLRSDSDAMRALCTRLLEAVRGMERAETRDVRLTVSVGWALYPDDAETIDGLVAAADVCMRGAKLTGKDRALSAVDWAPAA